MSLSKSREACSEVFILLSPLSEHQDSFWFAEESFSSTYRWKARWYSKLDKCKNLENFKTRLDPADCLLSE